MVSRIQRCVWGKDIGQLSLAGLTRKKHRSRFVQCYYNAIAVRINIVAASALKLFVVDFYAVKAIAGPSSAQVHACN